MEIKVNPIVLRALKEADGVWETAEQELASLCASSSATLQAFALIGIRYSIRQLAYQDRSRILQGYTSGIHPPPIHTNNGDRPTPPDTDAALRYRGIYSYSLRGGLALGDATVKQVQAEAALRERLARSNRARAKFLRAVVDEARRAGATEETVIREVVPSDFALPKREAVAV